VLSLVIIPWVPFYSTTHRNILTHLGLSIKYKSLELKPTEAFFRHVVLIILNASSTFCTESAV